MKSIIIGMGEVGSAHYRLVKPYHKDTYCVDADVSRIPRESRKPPAGPYGVMHVCIRYSKDFEAIVQGYVDQFDPEIINICTTVPPGTTRKIEESACHSTTRGLHPNLDTGLKTITKHIGGAEAEALKEYFEVCGIKCHSHVTPETTELAHILNNAAYGINLMFADEMQKLCRRYGVDYFEAVMLYTQTNNEGYERLGHKSKRRTILTPPNGRIGGHCVNHSAELIPEKERPPMMSMLAKYGK